jgi:hypothetical protein
MVVWTAPETLDQDTESHTLLLIRNKEVPRIGRNEMAEGITIRT